MTRPAKIFRVFVSSTFSDMVEERNALQARVFPELQALCAQYGARFQAIDLRWGISTEAGLNQRATDICLREIARCQRVTKRPNFILLMGDRYGWQPAPDDIPANEFELLLQTMTADERDYINQWYRLDSNAEPSSYALQPRLGEYIEQNKWNEVETKLRQILLTGLSVLDWHTDKIAKYRTSVTEQEIQAGIFDTVNPEQSAFCFFRSIDDLSDAPPRFRDSDPKAHSQLADLKRRLQERLPNNSYHYSARWNGTGISIDHINQLCIDVYAALSRAIQAEMAVFEMMPPAEVERQAHRTFLEERVRHFVEGSQKDVLDRIKDYVSLEDNLPFIVYGRSGIGKSTIIGKAVQTIDATPLYRFIGITPNSSDIRTLLIDLCEVIQARYAIHDVIPQDFETLVETFPNVLKHATADQPIVVFLDALDQFSANNDPVNLRWLPAILPLHVKLVLSVIPGPYLDALKQQVDTRNFAEISAMASTDAAQLLNSLLSEAGRALQPLQRDEILTKFKKNGLPLYLKLAFEEARLWHSYQLSEVLEPDVPGLLQYNLFARLSNKAEHGQMLVSRSLAYLSAARNGLSEDEILDILTQDTEFWHSLEEITNDAQRESLRKLNRLPIAVWSRFYFDLEPYLIERGADNALLFTFYHRQFSETVDRLYLAPTRQERHAHLALFFEQQNVLIGSQPNARKVSEQAYQQAKANLHEAYVATLTDYPFLQAALDVRGVNALIQDCDLREDETIKLLQSTLVMSSYILIQDTKALAHQLVGRLMLHRSTNNAVRRLTDWIVGNIEGLYPQHLDVKKAIHITTGGASLRILSEQTIFNCAVFSPDDQFIASASLDKKIRIWDATTGISILTLAGHTGEVKNVAYSPDGKCIASASIDRTVCVWDTKTGRLLHVLKAHDDAVNCVAYSPDGLTIVSASSDRTIQLWDAISGEALFMLEGHEDKINCVTFSPNGHYIASASSDCAVEVWDAKTGNPLLTLEGQEDMNFVVFSPDERYVVSASGSAYVDQDQNCLYIWALDSGELLHRLAGDSDVVTGIAYSHNGKHIVSSSWDGVVRIWDAERAVLILNLEGHTGWVNSIAYSHNGHYLVSASGDKTIRIWNADYDTKGAKPTIERGSPVTSITYSPDGKFFASTYWVGSIPIWDANRETKLFSLEGHTDMVKNTAFSSDGRRIASASTDGTIRLWDAESGICLFSLETAKNHARKVVFSPDGAAIVSADNDRMVRLWDVTTGALRFTLPGHSAPVNSVAYSPNGKRIVSASEDKTIRVWDTEHGLPLMILEGNTKSVAGAAYTESGRHIISATTSIDGRTEDAIRVWDADTGKCIGSFSNLTKGYSDLVQAFPDIGPIQVDKFATNRYGQAFFWNQETLTLLERDGTIHAIFYVDTSFGYCTWAPDGLSIAIGDVMGRVRVLTWHKGKQA